MTLLEGRKEAPRRRSEALAPYRDQAFMASSQAVAGLGNMVFSLITARLLAPGSFAQFTSFLALYLLLSMPGSAISAVASLRPAHIARARSVLLKLGVAAGIVLAIGAPFIGPLLRLPVAMVVVLGLSGPALGILPLERGRLYGVNGYTRLAASLVAEPAIRLLIGVVLTFMLGAVGGALAVIVAGYAALEVARGRGWWASTRTTPAVIALPNGPAVAESLEVQRTRRVTTWTALAFLALVIVQNQDLLIANRMLAPFQAGQFAVISVLGGLSAFATMTVPLVLLPRAAGGQKGGLAPALAITALIGAAIVTVVAAAPGGLIDLLFGARYRGVAGIVVPYVAAMALLGVTRVLVAHRCATGAGRSSLALVAAAVVAQTSFILAFGHSTRSVALSTVAAVTALTVTLGAAETARTDAVRQRLLQLKRVDIRARLRTLPRGVLIAAAVGIAVRVVIPRGLWLDEATSVDQARMSFGGMITNLRTTDVHPPLYFSVLWATIRVFGSSEFAVRLPSIVAGVVTIPLLYLLGREAYDRRTGLMAAAAGSVAPIMVWYSQEARMYSLLMMFGVLALWAQVRIVRRGAGERWPWVVYAAASIGLVWTQYFGALQIVVQQLAFLAVIWVRHRRHEPVRQLALGWLVSAGVIVVFLLPLVPFAHQQFMVNQTAGKGFGGPQQVGSAASVGGNAINIYAALANVIWAVWGYHSTEVMVFLAALWPLGMLFSLVLLGRRPSKVTSLLVASVLGPGLVMFALGTVKRDLFDIRYLSTAVPVLTILIARLVTAVPRRALTIGLAGTVLIGSFVFGLEDQQYNGANPRTYDFRGALALVNSRAQAGDVVYYDPQDLREVVQYYAPDITLTPLTAASASIKAARRTHHVFIIASPILMNGVADADTLSHELVAWKADKGKLVLHRDLPNVEVWEFQ
ncbi:MAG TPA: glycosyltransferase family 39 protein [Acidimicrobiales bacterium]|jgi:uncharacterized membrane protein|nr:glycosyltransferase family 39 protein [Acidimicrobiales bacterium]